jgi:putative cardiolipin synthase
MIRIVFVRLLLAFMLAATLGACGSLPAQPPRTSEQASIPDPATALARVAYASTPLDGHSGFRLMPLGVYSLDARIQLALRAQRSLVLQYYQIENDDVGRLLLSTVRDAARRGVHVRILVDDLYTAKSQHLLLALSNTPNVAVRLFNPFCCGRDGFLTRFAASPLDVVRLNHRMHNKLFIADGVMAVVGGRNIANEYFVLGEAQNFIDMDALIVGKVVPQLESTFYAFWNSAQVWAIGDVVAAKAEDAAPGADFDVLVGASRPLAKLMLPATDILGYGPIGQELDNGQMGLIWGHAVSIADPPSKPTTMTAEEAIATSVTMTIWEMMRDANHQVDLSSPYLVPGDRGVRAIKAMTERNVKVTLLTNSLAANDEPLVHTGYARYREKLLRSGAQLYELSPKRTRASMRFDDFGKSFGRLHAKSVAIDRSRVYLGSMNLDPRSATQNTEMGVVVDSPALADELLRIFNISRLQNSYKVQLADDGVTLRWSTREGPNEVVYSSEPEASLMQKLYYLITSPFMPESLL